MSYDILFRLSGFRDRSTLAIDVPREMLALDALAECDRVVLRARPRFPSLHASGVRYWHPEGGAMRDLPWLDCDECIQARRADCKSLAAWRVAEIRERERAPAWFGLVYIDDGISNRWHAFVRRPGGLIEDPSRDLGME